MAKRVQRRRGSTSEHGSFTGAVGEITVDTTKDTAVVHDGSQAGGFALAREDMNNVTNRVGITQLNVSDGSNGQVLSTNGSGTLSFSTVDATSANVGGDLSGTVGNAQIVANAVGTTELAANAVTTAKVTDANITTAKLATNAVTTIKITDANVTTAKIADSAITSVKILDGTIVAGDLASDSVTEAKILNANITTAKLADNAVTTAKIAAGNVSTATIADASINSAKLADDAVTESKVAANAVTTVKILDANVTAAKLADDAVTSAKIAPLAHSVSADHSANGPHCNTLASGYSSTIMDLVYLGSSSKWLQTDADVVGESINMLGIALEAKSDTQVMNVALPGSFVRDDSWGWTAGVPLYVGLVSGQITATRPSSVNDVVRVVGYAVSSNIIFFNPSSDYITIL